MNFIKDIKLTEIIQRTITLTNFGKLLLFTLTVTWVFYLGSMNYSVFSYDNFGNLLQNYIILKFIGIYLVVRFVFYTALSFLLRLLFHGYVKERFLRIKAQLQREGRINYLKSVLLLFSLLDIIFRGVAHKLGFLTKQDLEEEIEVNDLEKEKFLNEGLEDCYRWICINIHLILTLTIIWQYLNLWIISMLVFILAWMFLLPLGVIFMAMNLGFLKRMRKKMLAQKSFL